MNIIKPYILLSIILLAGCFQQQKTDTLLSEISCRDIDQCYAEGFERIMGVDVTILEKVVDDTLVQLEFSNENELQRKLVSFAYTEKINAVFNYNNWYVIDESDSSTIILDLKLNSLFLVSDFPKAKKATFIFYPSNLN